jgi:hypothetical protein
MNGGGISGGTANNCIFVGNTVEWQGGGAYGAILNNCLFIGNSSGFSGGGAMYSTLNNCTLVGNYASPEGGAADSSTLNNCISYYNFSNERSNHSSCSLNFCCTAPLPDSGAGNITNAPMFINQSGGNLRLQTNSPCIDSGSNLYSTGLADLDGRPRLIGSSLDMGAYEFQGPGIALFTAWLSEYGLPADGSADHADSDGDRMNNWQEWIAGTNPTNSSSFLRFLTPSRNALGLSLTWQSVSGKTYFLERASSFSQGAFFSFRSNIIGQANATTYMDLAATNAASFFYRVGVQ